uniref:bifunctional glutamate N-acetyltransferase/amino-acid acetyltransferase ArgJ n=1 Tax=Eubacterium sp. TaxID=142586 RepID=UPI004026E8E3
MDFKIIDGGVCAPKGFKANGVYCGIKKSASAEQNPNVPHKNDLGMIVSDEICTCAAVYTTNKVKGAPILVTKSNLEKTNNHAKAVIVNSKNANTCNADGVEKASRMCELAAEALGINDSEVVVASTGVIGQILPIEPIKKGIKPLVEGLSYTGNEEAATAIMTTDTIKKEYAVEFSVNGKTCRVGGMAKGSGMIHPNMATTLNFITSDVNISAKMLQAALDDIVKVTYNCLSIDGDTSTNDMVSVMANGLAGNDEIISEGEEFSSFKTALYEVMMNLTKMLAKDGEGASKMIECECKGCADKDTAITVAKSVVGSTLFKCAVFGEDANWGRILCAVGYAPAEFDINKVDVDIKSEFGEIAVCRNGAGVDFSEEKAAEVLKSDEIYVIIDLNAGESSAKAWGCDLTYDYVKINGDYRT